MKVRAKAASVKARRMKWLAISRMKAIRKEAPGSESITEKMRVKIKAKASKS